MTDGELAILRAATLGPERGDRAGEHVTVRAGAAVRSVRGSSWEHVQDVEAIGWIDNLDAPTFMVYGRTPEGGDCVWALRFAQVESVDWCPAVAA